MNRENSWKNQESRSATAAAKKQLNYTCSTPLATNKSANDLNEAFLGSPEQCRAGGGGVVSVVITPTKEPCVVGRVSFVGSNEAEVDKRQRIARVEEEENDACADAGKTKHLTTLRRAVTERQQVLSAFSKAFSSYSLQNEVAAKPVENKVLDEPASRLHPTTVSGAETARGEGQQEEEPRTPERQTLGFDRVNQQDPLCLSDSCLSRYASHSQDETSPPLSYFVRTGVRQCRGNAYMMLLRPVMVVAPRKQQQERRWFSVRSIFRRISRKWRGLSRAKSTSHLPEEKVRIRSLRKQVKSWHLDETPQLPLQSRADWRPSLVRTSSVEVLTISEPAEMKQDGATILSEALRCHRQLQCDENEPSFLVDDKRRKARLSVSLDRLLDGADRNSTPSSSSLHRASSSPSLAGSPAVKRTERTPLRDVSNHDEGASSAKRRKAASHDVENSRNARLTDQPQFAEALWDHVTFEEDELEFRAGDLIEVLDMSDKNWWWGIISSREGWFPAAFVRLKVIQLDEERQHPNEEVRRANVVKEILQTERDYVHHLRDICDGYMAHAQMRTDMFNSEMIAIIFGNIEEIYAFQRRFLTSLELAFHPNEANKSRIGQCFLEHMADFVSYSEYCNNHPRSCNQLRLLRQSDRYVHFFEACRLLLDMIEINLEGFLLTPIQRICKYPLQLAELLKYTGPGHPDRAAVQQALQDMRHVATLINERKRAIESIERIAQWQRSVVDWHGPAIVETSSELIHWGEVQRVNPHSWVREERSLFMFDRVLIYCKKDLLKRDSFVYKGRVYLDHCHVYPVQDGKDRQFEVNVKNAWKIHDLQRDKWFLFCCKTRDERDRWLQGFKLEREQSHINAAMLVPPDAREAAKKLVLSSTSEDSSESSQQLGSSRSNLKRKKRFKFW